MSNGELLAARLEQMEDYQVLRRLKPARVLRPRDNSNIHMGLYVDVETTGLDQRTDQIIELGAIPFSFAMDGRLFDLGEPYRGLQEPDCEIPPQVQRLTGLSSAIVAGKCMDDQRVDALVQSTQLVVAHHAAFDRPFLERRFPAFRNKLWACSMEDVDWRAEGFDSTKLSYLGLKCGFFYQEHSALFDALAGIHLLNTTLPSTGSPAMTQLIDKLQKDTTRLDVRRAPFRVNALLRDRGYHFSRVDGEALWSISGDDDLVTEEERFLRKAGIVAARTSVSPLDRFSGRT